MNLKNEEQLDFIKAAMQLIDGSWSYWIGGSTTAEKVTTLSYCGSINYLGNISVIHYNWYDSF